jgi:O-antigen ligase
MSAELINALPSRMVKVTRVLVPPTNRFEQLILIVPIVLLPLQDSFTLGPVTFMLVWFGLMGAYNVIARPRQLLTVALRPIFLACYAFLVVAFLIESLHPIPDYLTLGRLAEVTAGAVFVATLCRDDSATRGALTAWVIGGVWLSAYLFLTVYGPLREAYGQNFYQASIARVDVLYNSVFHANLNTLSFVMAVATAFALALGLVSTGGRRLVLLVSSGFCLLGTFLPLSRAGVVIAILASLVVVLLVRPRRPRAIALAILIAASIVAIVPGVAFSRLQVVAISSTGQPEIRVQLYQAAFESLADYALFGVGSGNYWTSWAYGKGFTTSGRVIGTHNAFLQVEINWGLAGLALLVAIVGLAFRSLKPLDSHALIGVCLRALGLALLVRLMVSHDLYSKEFAIGLGLIVGAAGWKELRGNLERTN